MQLIMFATKVEKNIESGSPCLRPLQFPTHTMASTLTSKAKQIEEKQLFIHILNFAIALLSQFFSILLFLLFFSTRQLNFGQVPLGAGLKIIHEFKTWKMLLDINSIY